MRPRLTVGGQALALKPGTFHSAYPRGLHAPLPEALVQRREGDTGPFKAEMDLELVGTESVAIVPLGSQTQVQMDGRRPHPSFAGRFLPSERTVGDKGFSALWRLSSLASTAQQDVAAGRPCAKQRPRRTARMTQHPPTVAAAPTASPWPSWTRSTPIP